MIILFIVVMVYLPLSIYHFARMVLHMRRDWWVGLLGGIALFMPSLFDDEGNKHRVLFGQRILIAAPSMAALFLLKELAFNG